MSVKIEPLRNELEHTANRINKLESEINAARVDEFFHTMEAFRNGIDK